MTNPASFEKTAGEQYPIGFTYKGRLPAGATITSAAITAADVDEPETDLTADLVVSSVGTVADSTVRFAIKGGEVGHSYKLTVVVQLSTGAGDNLEDSCVMKVT